MEQGRSTSLRLGSGSQQKNLPRDINEALGRLPPQALEMEEAVLGALMLEAPALELVKFLIPEHFYDERHKEIYRAISSLKRKSIIPDMRSVVVELREVGKLEMIGGAYAIGEITSKISSAANIEHHARVVVEMAMKRNLIEIASLIHKDAYEDTTDVFQLLEQSQRDLKFLEERETKSSGPEKIKQLWEATLVTSKPDEQPPLIILDGTPVATPGNHTLLIGGKKSRKSLLVTQLLSIFLKPRDHYANNIAVFDTEQGRLHVWKGKDRLYRMTGQETPFFWLRGKSPQERREFISQSVAHWNTRSDKPLKIIVIDGIRDCMSNINDPDESTEVIVWLEKLTLTYNLSIINILHTNKTDGNARGHIGSELLNKAECTIEVELDKKSGHSVVKCESSREKPFEPFMFTHGPTGLPEMVGVPMGTNAAAMDEKLTLLEAAFEGESLKYKELVTAIKSNFKVGDNKAKQFISDFTNRGWIIKSGSVRAANTTYKLVASHGKYVPPVEIEPQLQQSSLFENMLNSEEFTGLNQSDPPPVDDLPF